MVKPGDGGTSNEKDPVESYRANIRKYYEPYMTEQQKNLFNGMTIEVKDSLKNAQYDATDNIMYIGSSEDIGSSFYHELLHGFQDQELEALDDSKSYSNPEFQVYMMEDVIRPQIANSNMQYLYVNSAGQTEIEKWVKNFVEVDKETFEVTVNAKGFESGNINPLYEAFRTGAKEQAVKETDPYWKELYSKYA